MKILSNVTDPDISGKQKQVQPIQQTGCTSCQQKMKDLEKQATEKKNG